MDHHYNLILFHPSIHSPINSVNPAFPSIYPSIHPSIYPSTHIFVINNQNLIIFYKIDPHNNLILIQLETWILKIWPLLKMYHHYNLILFHPSIHSPINSVTKFFDCCNPAFSSIHPIWHFTSTYQLLCK